MLNIMDSTTILGAVLLEKVQAVLQEVQQYTKKCHNLIYEFLGKVKKFEGVKLL